jgi:hypothetical protein
LNRIPALFWKHHQKGNQARPDPEYRRKEKERKGTQTLGATKAQQVDAVRMGDQGQDETRQDQQCS